MWGLGRSIDVKDSGSKETHFPMGFPLAGGRGWWGPVTGDLGGSEAPSRASGGLG